MIVMPAIDLERGRCVQLVQGTPGSARVVLEDPAAVAGDWERQGASWLHVVDLDAAMGRGENLRAIEAIAGAVRIPIQVGGGVRNTERFEELLDLGAARVIIGTRAVLDEAWLKEVTEAFPGRAVVAADARADEVAIQGWTKTSGRPLLEFVRSLSSLPLAGLLYTNISVEGLLQGIDPVPIRALLTVTHHPLLVSGGVTTVEDLLELKGLGVSAAIVGMALYLKRIRLEEAIERCR